MNERIKELALQADQYERKLGKGIGTSRDEKFAELIIKECLLYTSPSPHEGTEMGRTLAWVDKNIKQHFGVEE